MKNLILSRNQRFKEEYNHAERTNNWGQLQQMLRSGYFDNNLFSTNQTMMQEMEHAFTQMGTPPMWPIGSGNASAEEPVTRKRMAETTTPVPRGTKKNAAPVLPLPANLAAPPSARHPSSAAAAQALDTDDGGEGEDSEHVAKLRKNERERQRRLAVSSGFDELCAILRLPQMSQKDKVSILRNAIDRIKELERRVGELERVGGR